MHRVVPFLSLVILLSAGCAQPSGPDQPSAGGEGAGSGDAEQQAGGPGATTTSDPTISNGPSGAMTETWYLHIDRTCDGQDLCNCGSTRTYMDRENTTDDCDAHGDRPFHQSPSIEPRFILAESWPNDAPSTAWPAGSTLAGVLYVTTDVQSSYDYFLRLRSANVTHAESAPRQGTAANGQFGLQFSPLPFEATLDEGTSSGARLVLEFHIRWHVGSTSYFVGYNGDHASRFTIAPPA